jgi:hypothetical protein
MSYEPKKITEMWAWVCTEDDGGEGLPAFEIRGMVMPLVGADRKRVDSLRPYAESVVNNMGLPMKLVKFTNMEVVELIDV